MWLTEAGVYRYTRGGPVDPTVGATELTNFFNSSTYRNNLPVISRFYYYEWHGDPQPPSGYAPDLGLTEPAGTTTRPVYCAYRARINPCP